MLTQFLAPFYGLFIVLSVGYVLVQRRKPRLVWAAVYVLLILGLGQVMFWRNQQLIGEGIYLEVGHAGEVLVAVELSWFFFSAQLMLYLWFTFPEKK